jgi:hypothetical protein
MAVQVGLPILVAVVVALKQVTFLAALVVLVLSLLVALPKL